MGIFRSQGQRKNVKQNGILQSNYKLENEGQTVLSNNLITLLRIITTSHYMVPEVFFVQKGVMTRKLLFFKNQTNCYTQHLCTKQVTCLANSKKTSKINLSSLLRALKSPQKSFEPQAPLTFWVPDTFQA